MIDYSKFFIGGEWKTPSGNEVLPVVNPTTEMVIGSIPRATTEDMDAAVKAARDAFDDPSGWATWSPERRQIALERFAVELESRGAEMARRVSLQNGMPINSAMSFESAFPPVLVRYFAQMVAQRPSAETREGLFGGSTRVLRHPIGVVAAITPWNVPQGITMLKLAPALAAGCTLVLKAAEETVLDAFLLAEAAEAANLPPGLINVVPASREVGAYLVEHPGVDKVSFTGSTAAGRSIAETCGRLLRPVTLELGGKSAAVILDDADLQTDIDRFFGVTMTNNGQVCWLNSRILAPRSRYKEVVDFVTDMAKSVTVGDPLDPATQMGPLVSARQRTRVEDFISQGKAQGARLTTGGNRPGSFDHGFFLEPTVFADVDNSHGIAQQEIFGPVLSVIPYEDDEHAIAIANDSDYGLGGSIWTRDADRGESIARRIHTGTIGINAYSNDPAAPFGGVKQSGLGRELGHEGLASFEVLKSVYLDTRLN